MSASSRTGFFERVVRIVAFRRILGLLVRRDLKVRYAGSALGYLWTVLEPLMMSLIYYFIVVQIFARKAPGEDPYILFIVIGQLTWGWFNGGVLSGSRALRSESAMVRSTNVPRELWVLRVIASKFVEFLFAFPVVAFFAIAYGKAPNRNLALLPLGFLLMFLLLTGLCLLLSPLNVLVRDTERLVPIILRIMFYLSPILYGINGVIKSHPGIGVIYGFNPLVGPLSLMRAGFFPEELKWGYIWHSMVICVVLFGIGMYTFLRLERPVLKEI